MAMEHGPNGSSFWVVPLLSLRCFLSKGFSSALTRSWITNVSVVGYFLRDVVAIIRYADFSSDFDTRTIRLKDYFSQDNSSTVLGSLIHCTNLLIFQPGLRQALVVKFFFQLLLPAQLLEMRHFVVWRTTITIRIKWPPPFPLWPFQIWTKHISM